MVPKPDFTGKTSKPDEPISVKQDCIRSAASNPATDKSGAELPNVSQSSRKRQRNAAQEIRNNMNNGLITQEWSGQLKQQQQQDSKLGVERKMEYADRRDTFNDEQVSTKVHVDAKHEPIQRGTAGSPIIKSHHPQGFSQGSQDQLQQQQEQREDIFSSSSNDNHLPNWDLSLWSSGRGIGGLMGSRPVPPHQDVFRGNNSDRPRMMMPFSSPLTSGETLASDPSLMQWQGEASMQQPMGPRHHMNAARASLSGLMGSGPAFLTNNDTQGLLPFPPALSSGEPSRPSSTYRQGIASAQRPFRPPRPNAGHFLNSLRLSSPFKSSRSVTAKPETCFSKIKSEVSSVSELIEQHKAFCLSAEFGAFVSLYGLGQPSFKASPHLETLSFDKFTKAWNHLEPDSNLAIVFHGTSERNVPGILANGLDPTRRRGQAYGPGEYFSTDPRISVSYCRGGLQMLVFIVVIPRERQERCPADYVVVSNNDHQLPLGSVSFAAVDREIARASSERQQKLAYLSRFSDMKTQEANDAMFKATIIQLVIGKKVDIASEKYQKHMAVLSATSKREISMYVHRLLDDEVISYYFPDLPEPMMAAERDTAAIRSVDESERDAAQAKEALEKAKMDSSLQK